MAFVKTSIAVSLPKIHHELPPEIGEIRDGKVWDGKEWIPEIEWEAHKKEN